jgi:hypothetical protein
MVQIRYFNKGRSEGDKGTNENEENTEKAEDEKNYLLSSLNDFFPVANIPRSRQMANIT